MADLIRRSEARAAFGADPTGYDAGRPEYPSRIYELLIERCGLGPGTRVLEVGPGTGMVTRHLLDAGASVVGVEPDPVFAAHLRAGLPAVRVIEAALEDARLEHLGTFDLAVAAMSFHWVDQVVGLPKLGRLLAAGGWVALWWTLWNDYQHPDAFNEAAQQLHGRTESEPNQIGRPQFELDEESRLSDLRQLAGLVEVAHEATSWTMEMDAEQVRAHYASMIAVRRRPYAERERLLDALAALVNDGFGGKVERRFLTLLYTGRKPLSG